MVDRRDIARRAMQASQRPREATPREPGDTTTPPAPGPGGVGDTLKGAASSIAANAARGAMTGGLAGATRAVAVGALRDKDTRKILLALLAVLLIAAMLIGMAISSGISAASYAFVREQENTNSQQAAREAGIEPSTLQAVNASEHDNLPWPLKAATLDTDADADLKALEAKLDELDPPRAFRDFTTYTTRDAHSSTLTAQLEENPGKSYYATHEKIHLEALTAAGLDTAQAKSAYELAMKISLGVNSCVAAPPPGPNGDGESFTYAGTTYEDYQVANMKTLIGLAKTMFPADWEKAATIGLITSRVESRFQNYANDGVVGPEDKRMAPYTASDYARLAYSLKLPHDATGTDHASVGIMQQQATYWGQLPGSTFENDSAGVIERLMTPAYAAALFYERLPGISGWQSMEPGSVAQKIQVSATPDAYRKHIDLATAILTEYGQTTAAIAVPDSLDWNGQGNNGDTNGDGRTTDACGESGPEGKIPTGDEQQLAQALLAASDAGKVVWYADPAEGYNQIKAYADGSTIPANCTLDPRILQLLVMTTEQFDKMSINSLNRACTGSTVGIGKASAHWRGQAGDIGFLNGTNTVGNPASAESYQWWDMFARVAKDSGGGLGQSQCRSTTYPGIAEYEDGCNHLHFEIGRNNNTTPLKG